MAGTPIKVAIIGNGLASVCVAKGLKDNPRFQVEIFEGSDGSWVQGQAFGLGSNAQRALELLNPELRKALDDAGGTVLPRSAKIGTGPDAGEFIAYLDNTSPQIVVGRGVFQREINKTIPGIPITTNAKVARVEPGTSAGSPATVHFEDGKSLEFDAVIGGDGLNSVVRAAVLGADNPATKPRGMGGFNMRIVVPLEKGIEAFGKEHCEEDIQTGWVGDGGFLLTDKLDNGQSMQVIAGWKERPSTGTGWPYEEPFHEWSKDEVAEDLRGWGNIGKGMAKLFAEQEKLYAAAARSHIGTTTYRNGNACTIGDAAESFAPARGAGAGQAIEDALLLQAVLNQVKSKADIPKAMTVYDQIRRPRRSEVALQSNMAGLLLCGRSDAGVDKEKLKKKFENWNAFIYEYDLKGMVQEGKKAMQ
ncbi:6-methylsalicylic acid decarboxylase atA [Pseudocercospora fuligena]|uniref:6-methylsalicylic acid decarboxylase atA n=1 Tax=Pseudocercospora fuligena TaxID=685502 RepID=A0A8H6RLN7_9PEZI|nr:6-methylsalicylic acid decarboxylase atA [Pseudocercospora fuligena]